MEKYVEIKRIELMTMSEAYERKLLKEHPSECETDKAGYLIEDIDGNQFWTPYIEII